MVYEFLCPACQHRFEINQAMLAEHKANSPKCGKPAQRIFSGLGFYWDKPKPLYYKDGSYEEKY